jgi:hypothetical protein
VGVLKAVRLRPWCANRHSLPVLFSSKWFIRCISAFLKSSVCLWRSYLFAVASVTQTLEVVLKFDAWALYQKWDNYDLQPHWSIQNTSFYPIHRFHRFFWNSVWEASTNICWVTQIFRQLNLQQIIVCRRLWMDSFMYPLSCSTDFVEMECRVILWDPGAFRIIRHIYS